MNRLSIYIRNVLLFSLIFATVSPFSVVFAGEETTLPKDEIAQLKEELKEVKTETQESVKQTIEEMKRDKQDGYRNKNRIVWSFPAGFPEGDFDRNAKDLKVHIPLYGKVSLGEEFSAKFTGWWNRLLNDTHLSEVADAFEGVVDVDTIYKNNKVDFSPLKAGLDSIDPSLSGAIDVDAIAKGIEQSAVRRFSAPGIGYYDLLRGKKLPGVGIYRSDLNEIGFLAANLVTSYVLFKDLKAAKADKIKNFINANKDKFIALLEKLEVANDKKEQGKVKQEIKSYISKNLALFTYNPFKKEMIWPLMKYILFQRFIENIRSQDFSDSHNPEYQYAFVKNEKGELVRSDVIPISAVSVAKHFLAPVAELSQTTKEKVYKTTTNLRFTDRLCSHVHVPAKVYQILSGVVGESLVLIFATKIMDGYLNTQLLNGLVAKPNELLASLKESKQFDGIEYPSQEQSHQMIMNQEQIAKQIRQALSSGKTEFFSWIKAKRATFAKIAGIGFVAFVLPSLLIKVAPLMKSLFNLYRGK